MALYRQVCERQKIMSENTNANKSSKILRFFKKATEHVIKLLIAALFYYEITHIASILRDLASRIVGYDYSIWLNGALIFFRWIYEQITIQRLIIIVLQIIAAGAIIIASIVSIIVALWIIAAPFVFIINIPKIISNILFQIAIRIDGKSERVQEIFTLIFFLWHSPKKIREKVQFRKIIYGK